MEADRPRVGHPPAGGQLAAGGGKAVVSVNGGMVSLATEIGGVSWCGSRAAGFLLTDRAAYLFESCRLGVEGAPP